MQKFISLPMNHGPFFLPGGSVALNIQFPHQGITPIMKPPERKKWQKQGPPFQTLSGCSEHLFYLQLTGKGFVTWEVRLYFECLSKGMANLLEERGRNTGDN